MGCASHAAPVRGGVAHEDVSDLVLRRTVDPPYSVFLGGVVVLRRGMLVRGVVAPEIDVWARAPPPTRALRRRAVGTNTVSSWRCSGRTGGSRTSSTSCRSCT